MKVALTIALALAGLTAANAHAATITVSADADTFIRGGTNRDVSFNSSPVLLVQDQNGTFTSYNYTRFDLSGVNGTITEAALELDALIDINDTHRRFGFSDDIAILGLNDAAGDDWDEATLTSSNAPGPTPINGTTPTSSGSTFTFLGEFETSPQTNGETLSFSNAAIVDFLNNPGADALATLILVELNPPTPAPIFNFGAFATRENGTAAGPRLSLTTDVSAVPLPASGFLLLAGLAGLGFAKRRFAGRRKVMPTS